MRTAIWPMRAAGQTVRSAKRLRAQQHVHAERTALPHQTIQQQGGILSQFVVVGKQFLEFVDHQQNSRHRAGAGHGPIGGHVLHAGLAEQIAAAFQFGIQFFNHAQAEFPFAFDGNDPGMRATDAWRRF